MDITLVYHGNSPCVSVIRGDVRIELPLGYHGDAPDAHLRAVEVRGMLGGSPAPIIFPGFVIIPRGYFIDIVADDITVSLPREFAEWPIAKAIFDYLEPF